MELIFINMGIIVLFLWWGFVLICKSCGANIRDEDEELAWQKYENSKLRKIKRDEEKQIKALKEQQRISRAINKEY